VVARNVGVNSKANGLGQKSGSKQAFSSVLNRLDKLTKKLETAEQIAAQLFLTALTR